MEVPSTHVYETQMFYLYTFPIYNQYITDDGLVIPVDTEEARHLESSGKFDSVNNFANKSNNLKKLIERTRNLSKENASFDQAYRESLCTAVWNKFIENKECENTLIKARKEKVEKEKLEGVLKKVVINLMEEKLAAGKEEGGDIQEKKIKPHFYELQICCLYKKDIFNFYFTRELQLVPVDSCQGKFIRFNEEFDWHNNYENRKNILHHMIQRTLHLSANEATLSLENRKKLCWAVWTKFIKGEKTEKAWINFRFNMLQAEKEKFTTWMETNSPTVEDQRQVAVCINELGINQRLNAGLTAGTLGDAIAEGLDAISVSAKAQASMEQQQPMVID